MNDDGDPTPRGARISFYRAAEWLATEGGARSLDMTPTRVWGSYADVTGVDDWVAYGPSDELVQAWEDAVAELLTAIHDGRLPVRGWWDGRVDRPLEPISPDEFGDYIANPYRHVPLELMLGEKRYVVFESDTAEIRNRGQVFWSGLVVSSDDLLALEPAGDPKAIYKTGAPDRPTPIQFVEREWQRRRDAGESSRVLAWCKATHPLISTPAPKTIENRIRKEFREWMGRAAMAQK